MDKKFKLSNRWQIFFLIEIILLIISMIMPITPSKTGSSTKLADWFIKNPSYLEEVFFYLVFGNVIVIILAVVFLIWLRITKKASH
ncbi:hypothetical protein ES705_39533 [subsurface metagenome]